MKQHFLIAVTLLLTAGATHASPQPYSDDADTALLYHLDEDADATTLTESSSGRDATLGKLGEVGQPSMAGFGSALRGSAGLAARATFVDSGMGAASFLHPAITEDFTIEAWVKLDSTDFEKDRIIIVVQPVGVPLYDYALAIFGTDNKLHPLGLYLRDLSGGTKLFTAGGLTWDADTWYHVALVVDQSPTQPEQSTYRLYRTAAGQTEPQEVASTTAGLLKPNESSNDRQIEIANFYGNSGLSFWPGLIDEVRFSTTAREPSDFVTLGGE